MDPKDAAILAWAALGASILSLLVGVVMHFWTKGTLMVVHSGTPVSKGLFFERPSGGQRRFEWSVGYIRLNRLWYVRLRASWPFLRASYDETPEGTQRKTLAKVTLDLNMAGKDLKTLAGPIDYEEGTVTPGTASVPGAVKINAVSQFFR